jgi:hypothetical protein
MKPEIPIRSKMPNATPTPIPAFAPVLRPELDGVVAGEDVGV